MFFPTSSFGNVSLYIVTLSISKCVNAYINEEMTRTPYMCIRTVIIYYLVLVNHLGYPHCCSIIIGIYFVYNGNSDSLYIVFVNPLDYRLW